MELLLDQEFILQLELELYLESFIDWVFFVMLPFGPAYDLIATKIVAMEH